MDAVSMSSIIPTNLEYRKDALKSLSSSAEYVMILFATSDLICSAFRSVPVTEYLTVALTSKNRN